LGDPHPQQVLLALHGDPKHQVQGFIDDPLVLAHFNHQAIHVDNGIDGIQRARLKLRHFIDDRIRHVGNQGCSDLHAVQILQLCLDIARCQPMSIEREDFLVEAFQPRLMLFDQLRFEAAFAIPRNGQLHVTLLALERFPAAAIAAVGTAFFSASVLDIPQTGLKLNFEAALNHGLGQLLE
jgi:hypothetical protein